MKRFERVLVLRWARRRRKPEIIYRKAPPLKKPLFLGLHMAQAVTVGGLR